MSDMDAFAISLSGMSFQKLRLDTVAMNFANSQVTRSENGELYRPLEAVALPVDESNIHGVQRTSVVEKNVRPRKSFEPGHPDADAAGFVSRPGINPVDEMITLMTATRGYQANVQALNAAKRMAQLALETGGK